MQKPIIYQVFPRYWGNSNQTNKYNGSLEENGTGKLSDFDGKTLEYFKWLGCSHIWYTGLIRHSTKADTRGCTASNGQFVKGNAGSPFAICDYYDINPYLADNPDERMDEFKSFIRRNHDAGLKVVIDFIPNHVSRDYGKVCHIEGHPVLGADDDKSVHYSPDNDFYYYPGQKLVLPVAAEGEPYLEEPAMASGNNCFTNAPGINDWFETIKINYGETHTPTWDKMLDVVLYWAGLGVDGFRCDMVELVPKSFMKWLITEVRKQYPEVIFIAEVYNKEQYSQYVRSVGFDLLYDKSGLYDTLRAIVDKGVNDNGMPVELWQSTGGITRNWQSLGDLQQYMLNFLENHDEKRFPSVHFGGNALRTLAPLYTSLLMNTGAFMIYYGEEVGADGMENSGYSAADGRTTIFDWWSFDAIIRLRKVIGSGAYKSLDRKVLIEAGMRADEAEVFIQFASAVRFAANDLAVSKGTTYDLCYCNLSSDGFDRDRHYVFLRDYQDHTLLIACNYSGQKARMKISLPLHAFEWMEIPQTDGLNQNTVINVEVAPFGGTIITLI